MEERRDAAVAAAVREGVLASVEAVGSVDDKPLALLYDLDKWEENLQVMREKAFAGAHFLHACAVKTNPLKWFLARAKSLGHGAECASVSEVMHALEIGFKPADVVYDSPCKTLGEIRFALDKGVHVNIDNLQELARVSKLLADGAVTVQPGAPIGIRVNPLVGSGTIAAFSVSTGKSKFGVPLPAQGAERQTVLDAVLASPWINCVHVHVGSGGMGLSQLVQGVRTAVDFALEVNKAAGKRQITVLDMGGGLAVDFKADDPVSDFVAYADAVREAVPEIFDDTFDRVVSEFGASAQTKFAFVASRVEYTKSYDGGRIALIHAGSDLFMRACYCPETFVHHRVFAYDAAGARKSAPEAEQLPHDIAGPLCFAGDVVVRDAKLPPLQPDDIVVLADAGGNSLSIRTSHCSRQSPRVVGYRISGDAVTFTELQPTEPVAATLAQWRTALPTGDGEAQ